MIAIIAACSKHNNAIGKNGKIPWDLPGERFYFKSLTLNSAVIMGRKTFQSIGKALPQRFNIVLSNTENYEAENLMTAKNLEIALNEAKSRGFENIFIIGGEKVYQEAMKTAGRIYLTEVDVRVEDADAFFPKISMDEFTLESKSEPIFENGVFYVKKVFRKI